MNKNKEEKVRSIDLNRIKEILELLLILFYF